MFLSAFLGKKTSLLKKKKFKKPLFKNINISKSNHRKHLKK
jgi:hypothetical protein